jgi:hypothetical protein
LAHVAAAALVAAALAGCVLARSAIAQQDAGDFAPQAPHLRGRLEAKRQDTSRGTPEESTRTTLRAEKFYEGALALLRLDVPFPDEKTDFQGSPFNPQLGDLKLRAGLRALRHGAYSFPSFVELTLPTADSPDAGGGKVQLSGGIRMLASMPHPFGDRSHSLRLETELQQVNSVAGDAARKDINYTKLELTLFDTWRAKYTAKLKLKPTFDHILHDNGAVAEVEGGMNFGAGWRTWLMLGRRAWGPAGIAMTYDDRVEIGVNRTF